MARLIAEPGTDRRAQIVEAAAAVLGRQGYEQTSMKDVALEAGVSTALVHYYFGTKDDLLLEVVGALDRQLDARWKSALEAHSEPLDRVVAATRAAAETCADNPEFFRILFDMYAAGLNNPALGDRVRAMVEYHVASVATEVKREQQRLGLAVAYEPEDMAVAVIGAIDGIAMISRLSERAPAGGYQVLLEMLYAYMRTAYELTGREVPPPPATQRPAP